MNDIDSKMDMKKLVDKLDLKEDEMSKLSDAFKNEEFCKLFSQYAQELSDPETREKHNQELLQWEKQQGRDSKIITPCPFIVVKCWWGPESDKMFVNIGYSDLVDKAECKSTTAGCKSGVDWTIPHMVGKCHLEKDKKGKDCKVYDVVFHTGTIDNAKKDKRFMDIVVTSCLDTLRKRLTLEVSDKFKIVKNLKVKGSVESIMVRGKSCGAAENDIHKEATIVPRVPVQDPVVPDSKPEFLKYEILYQEEVDVTESTLIAQDSSKSRFLILRIYMLDNYDDDINLHVVNDHLTLKNTKSNVVFLDFDLPVNVMEDEGTAQYFKLEKILNLKLKIQRQKSPVVEKSDIIVPSKGKNKRRRKNKKSNNETNQEIAPRAKSSSICLTNPSKKLASILKPRSRSITEELDNFDVKETIFNAEGLSSPRLCKSDSIDDRPSSNINDSCDSNDHTSSCVKHVSFDKNIHQQLFYRDSCVASLQYTPQKKKKKSKKRKNSTSSMSTDSQSSESKIQVDCQTDEQKPVSFSVTKEEDSDNTEVEKMTQDFNNMDIVNDDSFQQSLVVEKSQTFSKVNNDTNSSHLDHFDEPKSDLNINCNQPMDETGDLLRLKDNKNALSLKNKFILIQDLD